MLRYRREQARNEVQVVDLNSMTDIVRELEKNGHAKEAQGPMRAYGGGCTGNEILGGVRFHLRQIDRANLAVSVEAKAAIRQIIEEIDKLFPG